MAEMFRFRANWSGISGGTGVTTLHFVDEGGTGLTVTDANSCHSNVRLLFENTAEWLPNDVTISFPATLDVIDTDTGLLTSVVTASSPASNVTGSYTGNWQNGVGTRIVWSTGEIATRRRVKGATYLVPFGGIFDNDGTLSSAATTDVAGVATTLRTASATAGLPLVIWAHQRLDYALVTGSSVSDKVVVLRTRRD